MKVWVMQGSYESELFSSVHMTQKGCALACIADVLDFLGVGDEETALSVIDDSVWNSSETVEEGTKPETIEWDHEKLKEMTSEQLWKIFADWCEMSWERMGDRSYYIDAKSVQLQG